MAENKKSFVLYADLIITLEHLTNEEKGILFNHLLLYVNDMNPVLEDRLLLTAWRPIETQLKRDLEKYKEVKKKRSEAGKKGGINSGHTRSKSDENEANEANASFVKQTEANEAVNDTVNVNENVNDILLEKETKQINLSDQVSEDDFSDDKIPHAEKEKSSAKKEKPQPPDLETFLIYAQEVYQEELKIDYQPYDFTVRAKYQSWIDAGWKDGNKKTILNWKSKLQNTIPYLKPIYGKSNSNSTNAGFSNQKGNSNGSSKVSGKKSASTILADRARRQATGNSESGDTTIEVEVVG